MESFKVMAPTRVDLAGGTLDIWPLHALVGAAKTINLAIGLHALASFKIQASDRFRIEVVGANGESAVVASKMSFEEVDKLPASVKFPAWLVSRYIENKTELPHFAVQLVVGSEAPLRSGLGGSSALAVAMVKGLSRFFNDFNEQGWQWEMLSWVKDVEAAFIKTPTGTQDYLAAMFGGLNCFVTDLGGNARLPYLESVFGEVSERLIVLFSGEMHHSGLSNWEIYRSAFEGNKEVLGGLSAIRDVAEQLDKELRAGTLSWKHIGGHLTEEWRIRKTTFKVHTPRLEEILEFLHSKKVLGAKVCGAAQGGSLMALVDPAKKKEIIEACTEGGIRVLQASGTRQGVTLVTL